MGAASSVKINAPVDESVPTDVIITERVVYQNGDIYEGPHKGHVKCGKGLYKYSNGDIYEGSYEDNKKHGHGTYSFAGEQEGARYDGQFLMGELHGKGRYLYSNGAVFNGQFSHGGRHGPGTYIIPEQFEYFGTFEDGEMQGLGGITFFRHQEPEPSSQEPETRVRAPMVTFVGEFIQGKIHGRAMVHTETAVKYKRMNRIITVVVNFGQIVSNSSVMHQPPPVSSPLIKQTETGDRPLVTRPLPDLPSDIELDPKHQALLMSYRKEKARLGLGVDAVPQASLLSTPSSPLLIRNYTVPRALDPSPSPPKPLMTQLLSGPSSSDVLSFTGPSSPSSPSSPSKSITSRSNLPNISPSHPSSSSPIKIRDNGIAGVASVSSKHFIDTSLEKLRRAMEAMDTDQTHDTAFTRSSSKARIMKGKRPSDGAQLLQPAQPVIQVSYNQSASSGRQSVSFMGNHHGQSYKESSSVGHNNHNNHTRSSIISLPGEPPSHDTSPRKAAHTLHEVSMPVHVSVSPVSPVSPGLTKRGGATGPTLTDILTNTDTDRPGVGPTPTFPASSFRDESLSFRPGDDDDNDDDGEAVVGVPRLGRSLSPDPSPALENFVGSLRYLASKKLEDMPIEGRDRVRAERAAYYV